MRKLILICVLVAPFCSVAQTDTTKVLDYNIKGQKSKYRLYSVYDYLFAGSNNKLTVSVKGENRISELKATNGTLIKSRNDSVYIITNIVPGTTLISIYEKGIDGKNKLISNQSFEVVDYPQLFFNGVKSDSVISKYSLCGGVMYSKYDKPSLKLEVVKFKMDIYEDGVFKLDSSMNNRLTKKMRVYVSKLKEGSVVILKDVEYMSLDGQKHTRDVFRLFIGKDEKNPIQFGF